MTQFSDQIRLGAANFGLQANWSGGGQNGLPLATAPQDAQVNGVPLTQTFWYQIGTASTAGTATAGRFFYSATGATGGITLTAFTNDVPRGARIFSSVNLSTVTFTLVGQDGYGQTQVWSGAGPTGNTLGNTGSYVDTTVTWHTITTASGNGSTGTTAFGISNNDTYGLPYVLSNIGMALGVYIDGSTASIAPTFTAAFTPTGTPTATTADVRGTVALATAVLSNDSRYITVGMITPNVNLTPTTDDKLRSYGAKPYSG